MDEYGFSFDHDCDTFRKPLVAVFPHPLHGRLVEKIVLMVSHKINYRGLQYRLSWRDSGVAFYRPI